MNRAEHPEAISHVLLVTSFASWKPAGEANIREENGILILNDTSGGGWHFMRLSSADVINKRVTLVISAKPAPCCDTSLYVHHHEIGDVARISSLGNITHRTACDVLLVEPEDNGWFRITVSYISYAEHISIGTFKDQNMYRGSGNDQYHFRRIDVLTDDKWLDKTPDSDKLNLVDIGAAGGIQGKWRRYITEIIPCLFEPNPHEAAKIRSSLDRIPGSRVVEAALGDVAGEARTLNIAQYWGCTSLLLPNMAFLGKYSIGHAFQVIGSVEVSCSRYDALYAESRVPVPEVIKIDVQGFELNVLKGFGETLMDCLGIELEAHFYPIYQGQALIGDIVEFLNGFGLVLRKTEPVDNFDNDLVEVDAYFTCSRDRFRAFGPEKKRKFTRLIEIWGLNSYEP